VYAFVQKGSGVLRLFWKFWGLLAGKFWLQFCFDIILSVLTSLFPSDCILIQWCRIVAYKVLGVSSNFVCANFKRFRTFSYSFGVRFHTSFRVNWSGPAILSSPKATLLGAPVVVPNISSFWQWTFGRAQRILRSFALGRRCCIFSISN
jgi:hypothetical protein